MKKNNADAPKDIEQEFEQQFEQLRKSLKLTHTLDEYDSIFYFRDIFAREKFISTNLSRTLAYRIAEFYSSWLDFFQNLMSPNPYSYINSTESSLFSQEEKAKLAQLMQKTRALVTLNLLIGLTKNKKKEAEYFNDAIEFWQDTFKPQTEFIIQKIHDQWIETGNSEPKVENDKPDYV